MRKRILLILAVIVIIVVAYFAYIALTTRSHSPADVAKYASDEFTIEVEYCRPYKKGRLIFGDEADGALQPYGKYWRVGANEATKVIFNRDVSFGGQDVSAGSYAMYAIPGPDRWTIALNSNADRWGATPPDREDDVVRIEVNAENSAPELEQFEISFVQDTTFVKMQLHWDQTRLSIPIRTR